jgi:hypothetical protein
MSCIVCGAELTGKQKKFCSVKCSRKHYYNTKEKFRRQQNKKPRYCVICNSELPKGKKKYCSHKCKSITIQNKRIAKKKYKTCRKCAKKLTISQHQFCSKGCKKYFWNPRDIEQCIICRAELSGFQVKYCSMHNPKKPKDTKYCIICREKLTGKQLKYCLKHKKIKKKKIEICPSCKNEYEKCYYSYAYNRRCECGNLLKKHQKLFCSIDCRIGRRKYCVVCQKELLPSKSDTELRKFCSNKCYREFHNLPNEYCLRCGAELLGNRRKYCSRKCQMESKPKKQNAIKKEYKKPKRRYKVDRKFTKLNELYQAKLYRRADGGYTAQVFYRYSSEENIRFDKGIDRAEIFKQLFLKYNKDIKEIITLNYFNEDGKKEEKTIIVLRKLD